MKRSSLWLLSGAVLVVLANLRWGVGVLAWLAPVPLLHYLRATTGWRSRAAFVGVLVVAWTAATAKIVTAPLPFWFSALGIAFGLIQAGAYLGADWMRRRIGEPLGVLAFPAVIAVVEWLQPRATELATWSATGYTQVDDLPLLQLASVVGLYGVGFVVNAFAATLELAWATPARRPFAAAVAAVAALHAAGAARLNVPNPETTRVAAIGTIATFGPDTRVDAAQREEMLATLIADTTAAAHAGARIVVWTEAAALILPDDEPATIARLQGVARDLHIHLVAAYVMPGTPRFTNKYVWLRPDGALDHAYWKHHPAPGEPAVVGTAPLAIVDGELGRLGGAICYDYDFPQLAAEHGARGADLVALPSSDWRGIDPIHTQMAAVRAIEQGFSVVRSTRFGLSAGIDPYGRMRGLSSSFETGERVLLVDLPRHGVPTVYRAIGDAFVAACAAGLALGLLAAARRRR